MLWTGVAGDTEPLERLSASSRSAAVRAGVEVDGSKFRPHLTLARANRPVELTRWLRVFDLYTGPSWQVARSRWCSPSRAPGGSRYQVHEVFPLGAGRRSRQANVAAVTTASQVLDAHLVSRLEEIAERDGWRCWLCDEPVDPAMSVNDARGPSMDSLGTAKARGKAAPVSGWPTAAATPGRAPSNRWCPGRRSCSCPIRRR